jgi:hypothetical protein
MKTTPSFDFSKPSLVSTLLPTSFSNPVVCPDEGVLKSAMAYPADSTGREWESGARKGQKIYFATKIER